MDSERVILQFMCFGCLVGVTYLRYTVLTSPKKDETAVHCCDPALSLLIMLASRNVFHVVSALQSIVFVDWHFRSFFLKYREKMEHKLASRRTIYERAFWVILKMAD